MGSKLHNYVIMMGLTMIPIFWKCHWPIFQNLKELGTQNYCCCQEMMIFIPPQTVFVGGYTVFTSECPSIRLSDRPCVRNVLFL